MVDWALNVKNLSVFSTRVTLVWQCVLVTGETKYRENLHLMIDDYDILVLTPKILENHLHPDKIPSLSVFSLFIFDECHHTRKGEPYNSVMKNYLQLKKKGEKNLPQVYIDDYLESATLFNAKHFIYSLWEIRAILPG